MDTNSKVNLEIENPIICHSVEEGEENKESKLFIFLFLCTKETESKPRRVEKYEAELKKESESKEKVSSATQD